MQEEPSGPEQALPTRAKVIYALGDHTVNLALSSLLFLYPVFLTTFAKRFIKVVPEMGGTPVGSNQFDAKVIAKGYNVSNADPREMRRYF